MSSPAHSIDPSRHGAPDNVYASRNNLLYLVLGLIATAERVLAAAPELAPPRSDEPSGVPEQEVAATTRLWR